MEKREVKHMKPLNVETPNKTKRPSFLLTTQNAVFPTGRRNSRKPEFAFSPKVKALIQRLKFRLKLYMFMRKARENIEEHNEQVHPGYKFVVKILQNAYRSNENAEKILDYIKSLSFFSTFIGSLGDVQDKAMLELCKHLQYQYVPAGTYVFKEGDPSNNKYYVLLKGSICVIKKKDPKEHYKQRFMRLKAINQKLTADELHWEGLIGGMGDKINEIHEGEGFGEKALTEPDSLRTASVMTTTNCELIIIQKEHYLQITTRYDNRRQAKKAFMGKNIPFLDSLNSLAILDGLYSLLQEQEFPKEAIITSENQFGRNIYFVISGECAVEKTFLAERKKGKPEHGQVEVKRAISNIGEGSCFGEEILLDDQNQVYKYSVRVKSSSASFYYVEKSQLLIKFPPECVKLMKENFLLKDKVHATRIQDLEKDIADTVADRNHSQTDIKGTELFHLLNAQSRVRVAQQLYNSQRRSLKSPSPIRHTNHKGSLLALDTPKSPISIRHQLELDQQKVDISTDAIELEETSPSKEKIVHAIGRMITPLITEIREMRTGNASQSPIQQQQVQSRIKTRREATYKNGVPGSAKLRIAIDPLNKTTEGYFSQQDWLASPHKSKDYMGSFRGSPKKEEIPTSRLESKAMQEYSFKPALGPEKFDFGPSPYEKDKVIRSSPKSGSRFSSPLSSPQILKDGRSSVFLRTDYSEKQQAKAEFTNIVGRLTAGKLPVAALHKLTDLVIQKKPRLNQKRLRIGKKEDLILIKSLEKQSPRKIPQESINQSATNYKRYPKEGSTFRLHTAILEDSCSFAKGESIDGSLELSKIKEEQTERNRGVRPTTAEKKISVTKSNLIHLMKTKALAKLKDKDVLKSKAFCFE